MHVKLGNGDKTVFWEDIWIDGKTLKNRFPRIYSLESCKLITVGAKLAQPSLEYSFRRNPRGGVEQDQFNELSALVHDVSLIPMSDRWKWDLESSGDFSVASVRKIIDDKSLSDVDSKTRWIKYVPIKVNVHAWKVKTDSLPTRFNVSRRGINIDSIICTICDNEVETSRHLFFYCCMVRQIVRKITRWWDVPYVEVESYEDWYNWLVNLRISSMHKQMFEGVFYVMWWHLWSFRNKLIFDSKPPSQALFFDDVVSMSFHWCMYRCNASFSWRKKGEEEVEGKSDHEQHEESSQINMENEKQGVKEPTFEKEVPMKSESDMSRPPSFENFKQIRNGLAEISLQSKSSTKMSKLDRFLVSHSIIDSSPGLKVTALPRGWSDHTLIMLHFKKVDYGPIPFKFFHSWLQRDGFNDCVMNAYKECSHDNPLMTFHDKLKVMKLKIKAWNSLAKCRDASRQLQIKSKLLFIDDKINSGTTSEEEKVDRLNLLKEREDIQKLEDMDTVQKARIKWDIEGDENSKFFHGILKQKRHHQTVKGIMQDGVWITNPQQVKMAFCDFYKEKFKSSDNITNLPTVIPHSSLNNEENLELEKAVSVDEIKAAVWDCGSQKAPGPDGFSLLFLKHYWDLLKDDVVAAVTHTFDTFIIPKGVNSSFITLIPKKYLDHMLLSLGFGSKWRRWIKMCLHSTRASVLVNGSPSSEFLIKCGLRQGDPLSPFLFIIVMEGLHLALEDVVSSGLIHGAKVGNSDLYISHLFYANDVVIISEWNKQDMDNIIRILHVFYLASDLKINISKSHVYGLGVNSIDTGNMARDTGCSPGNIPLSYLGLPIGSNMNMIANWQHLIDRFRGKLSSWKANLLSIGGPLTLIKVGGSGDNRKMAWIKWDNILASLDKGGLEIGSLKAFNLALLQKWCCRLVHSPKALWVRVIKAIHGDEADFDFQGCNSNGIWTAIISSFSSSHARGIITSDSLFRKVGNESSIRFWKDNSDKNGPLSARYN
ncbi:putative RNA-directed DNA polymerase, eukaryota, reverse transcriptase zinc-binding domain protein, partial [Tanacetum coccineum]